MYVWPGFGSKVSADYGPLVGWSGLPEGLEYHVAFKSNGNFRVSEIWDSQKQLDAFGERLMPLLKDVGIELSGKPEVLEIHSILKR